MENRELDNAELVLTSDGRIYHLSLRPEDIADTIFLVGDPGRVKLMSGLFDNVETKVENREFVTHTGTFKGKRVSVISTGIGTDNIDITVNELDALFNIDFASRKVKQKKTKLQLVRIGTSGALQDEIAPGDVIVSGYSAGLDNLLYYYNDYRKVIDIDLSEAFKRHMDWPTPNSQPYIIPASEYLLKKIATADHFNGITLSAPGFYAPQGRSLRLPIFDQNYINKINTFRFNDLKVNNFEMEGSALYGLSRLLGHDALTICLALANRITGNFITDYQSHIEQLLESTLELICRDEE